MQNLYLPIATIIVAPYMKFSIVTNYKNWYKTHLMYKKLQACKKYHCPYA